MQHGLLLSHVDFALARPDDLYAFSYSMHPPHPPPVPLSKKMLGSYAVMAANRLVRRDDDQGFELHTQPPRSFFHAMQMMEKPCTEKLRREKRKGKAHRVWRAVKSDAPR